MKYLHNDCMNAIMASAVMALGLLVMLIGFNYQTIYLSFKGYSHSQIEMILDLNKEADIIAMDNDMNRLVGYDEDVFSWIC